MNLWEGGRKERRGSKRGREEEKEKMRGGRKERRSGERGTRRGSRDALLCYSNTGISIF